MSLGNSGVGRFRALLRHRDLRLLLAAGFVSQTGDWILGTGIAFQIYALTGSTLASAAALFATQAPQVLFGSVAGVLVDRWDKRRVMLVINVLLAVVLTPLTAVREASQVWIVIAVVAVSSCLTPFFVAAEVSLLPALVAEPELVTANAVNAQVRNLSRLVGAALGGLLVARGGLLWLTAADIATFVLAASMIALIRHRPGTSTAGPLHLVRDWVEGLAVIRRSRALVVVVVFFAVSGIGEGVLGTLFAPFVSDVLGGSGTTFGTILSAQAIGGIAGGVLITAVGHRVSPRTLFGWGALIFGLGDLALFLYPLAASSVWPAIAIIVVVGLPGAALFAGMLTIFQTATDADVRGRVYGTLVTIQNLTMLGATFAAGAIARPLGIVPVISVQGAVYVLVGLVVIRALRPSAPAGPAADPWPDSPDQLGNPAISTMLPTMPLPSNVRVRTVTDPLAMRALAHPLRVELYGLVAREGTLTAADAARQLDISHALASHHLRQLAKYGFVEPADTPDQRAHPWRVTATSLDLRPAQPDAQASIDVLGRFRAEQAVQQLGEWQQRRADQTGDWTAAGVGDSLLYLTPDELAALMAAWKDLVMPLADRRPIGHADARPADAVPVSLTLIAVPIPPTEQGG